MNTYASTPVNLHDDNDFVSAQWFSSQSEVFSCMSKMMKDGWRVTIHGLVSDEDSNPLVAMPIKIKGNSQFTGVGIWKISSHDSDNY